MKYSTVILFCLFVFFSNASANEKNILFKAKCTSIQFGEVQVTLTILESGAYIMFQISDKEQVLYKKLDINHTDILFIEEWNEIKIVLFDINNDQKDDILIGKYSMSTAGPTAGTSYLINKELLIQSDNEFKTYKVNQVIQQYFSKHSKTNNLNYIAKLYTQTFNFSGFLDKFKPLSYPCKIEKSICNVVLNQDDLVNYLNIDVDDNYDSLNNEGYSEEFYCAEYSLVKDEITTILYSFNSKSARGQLFTDMNIATFTKQGKLIDKKEIGSYRDYNEGFDTLTTLYTDKSTIEITPSNHMYVTNTHTNVLLDEEGDKDAINSNVIKTAYFIYEGRIDLTYKENLSDTTNIRAKFVDFDMGDAVYYDFETESGQDIGFGGKEINNIQFAKLLGESEMNSENQGWETNKDLQGKWFDITYIERQQPMYIDGPIGSVKIIIKAELCK